MFPESPGIMKAYSVKNITNITGGKIFNSIGSGPEIKYISIDSRTIADGKNTIFFALVGPRNDGHRFINQVKKKGVQVFVVSRLPENLNLFKTSTFIKVDDTLLALQKLTAYHRKQFKYPIIGITGSNGKTIIKEWLYDLLSESYSIIRSPKSYNSQIGVPLSAWLMNNSFNLAIFEAGISKPG
jgi:alanine racemase